MNTLEISECFLKATDRKTAEPLMIRFRDVSVIERIGDKFLKLTLSNGLTYEVYRNAIPDCKDMRDFFDYKPEI